MIFWIGIALTIFLVAVGSYLLASKVISLPSGRTHEAIRSLPGKIGFADRASDALIRPIAKIISRVLPISEYRTRQLQSDLDRLSKTDSPQNYLAQAMAKAFLIALFGVVFIPLGLPWLAMLTAVAGILAYFRTTQELREKVGKINRAIAKELPRLVESLNFILQDNRDMIAFFEKYRKVAGTALGRELDKLILAMKIGNHEIALREFDARLGISHVSALVSILCGVYQGIDQRTSLMILEQDIRAFQREQIRREMEKRPGRIKVASFILTVLMILMFMVPIVLMIIKNLQSVGF
jgi:ABC-type multidrug transport system fused ATPase/permease subunit